MKFLLLSVAVICITERPNDLTVYSRTPDIGTNCRHDTTEVKNFKIRVDAGWTRWSPYGTCSKTCGGGTQTRIRKCSVVSLKRGGRICSGRSSQTRKCNTKECPVPSGWLSWGPYGSCSKSCGGGIQTKERICSLPVYGSGGKKCPGKSTKARRCNTKRCPIEGGWSGWRKSSRCSMSCGGGHQKYVRYCNNPRPRYGGTSCVGNSIKYNECNTQNCPVNGGWSPWSSYGPCSKTCGRGTHTQTRTCSAPSPTYGGRKCSGRTRRSRQCNTQKCPIDGGWSAWRKYGRCSKTCGRGKQYLVRYCDTPTPRYNGKMCEGKNIQFEICNTKKCPVHGAWSDWSSYGDCSKTCGGGIQTQRRKCKEPKYGGRKCIGRSSRKRRCNIQKCPETCKCIAMGDPHYKTYDGQMIHFQGICKYLLTELTYKYDPCWFSVSVQNENRGSKRVSYTKMVEIETQGIKISLGKKGLVQVNGARVYLPYDKQEKIRIYRSGFDVCVETSCGQVITWNQRFTVTVTVDGKYRKQLRGICGDCNGIKDDFKTQQGVDVTNMPNRYSLIGKSWRIKDGSDAEKCTPIRPPAECTEKMREKAMRNDSCGFINPKKKDSSPFKKCIEKDKEAAQEVFENCVYDYCTYAKKSQWELRIAICNAVEGFAETCKDYGIAVKWRSETFCPIPCGKNQVYRYETSACPSTCVDPEAPDTCELPDVEGCECREGYALSDDKCVRLSKCGCFSDGKYYPVGKRVKLCKKELYCKMRRGRPVLQVTIITCSQYSVCKQIRGQYKCVCKEGYIGNGRSCQPEGCGGKRCHKFAICYKNQCRCKNGYNGDGVEVCDGGCQVRRQSSPQCGVTYRLSGTCHFTSEMRDDCQYTVDLYKSKAGRAQADLKVNQKIKSFKYGFTIKDCAMFTLRSNAMLIRDRACPEKCYKSISSVLRIN